jgi:cytochrome c553
MLDGYTSEQIYTGFQRYRQDPNGATAMHRMARGYSAQQVQLIADYLGQP